MGTVTVIEAVSSPVCYVPRVYTDEEICELFPEVGGSLVRSLLARAVAAEVEQVRLREAGDRRLCESCLEIHPMDVPCPPHEVRTTGQAWFSEQRSRIRAERDRLQQYKEELINLISAMYIAAEGPDRKVDGNELKAVESLRAERDRLREACQEAFGALVGAHPADDSVQGRARARLREVLGYADNDDHP
jgi:hypothetical protein